jgi:hypothetical protein
VCRSFDLYFPPEEKNNEILLFFFETSTKPSSIHLSFKERTIVVVPPLLNSFVFNTNQINGGYIDEDLGSFHISDNKFLSCFKMILFLDEKTAKPPNIALTILPLIPTETCVLLLLLTDVMMAVIAPVMTDTIVRR